MQQDHNGELQHRDMKSDNEQLHRMYFPNFERFSFADKTDIENDIQNDFDNAYAGILRLPIKARFGVYVAYKYYFFLFKKIKSSGLQNFWKAVHAFLIMAKL